MSATRRGPNVESPHERSESHRTPAEGRAGPAVQRADHEAPIAAESPELVSIQEASALLGVTPSTLRRWADAGRLPMTRTIGGHRRFARAAVLRLAGSLGRAGAVAPPAPRPPARRWGIDERELARQEWHSHLGTPNVAGRMRGLGQRLLGLLIQYVNRPEDDTRFLHEARALGASYGEESCAAGVTLQEFVQAYLYFRSAFSQLAMPLPGIAQPTDLAASAALQARISRFMDAILLGATAQYERDA